MPDDDPHWLIDGPSLQGDEAPVATLLLTHGSGAGMETVPLNAITAALAAKRVRVLRFEFAFMAAIRETGKRRPPPPIAQLVEEFGTRVLRAHASGLIAPAVPLYIAGKSLGGRAASMLLAEPRRRRALLDASAPIGGTVAFGYPFHPPGQPTKLRTAHLHNLKPPMLIIQGERDPFGGPEEVQGYDLPDTIRIDWIGDGDHDLVPRKKSGRTATQNWLQAGECAAEFMTQK